VTGSDPRGADLTNRRGLLRALASRAAAGANELKASQSALRAAGRQDLKPTAAHPQPGHGPRPQSAQLPNASIALDDVLDRARAHGLADRVEDVRRLCRPSVRLAPVDAERRSHAGCNAPPVGLEVPLWRGKPLPLVARLDLAEAAAAADLRPLPGAGTLWVFCDRDAAREQPARGGDGACRVLFESASRPPDPGARALAVAKELVLPRVWSRYVDELELNPDEQEAWEALRWGVAATQGVEAFDVATPRLIHRLLGWPDERGGWMPLASAMLAAGIEVDAGQPPAGPPTPELAAASARWTLLIQVSFDARERLYVWVDEDALAERDFARARAFVH
jgi:hypothetical protein